MFSPVKAIAAGAVIFAIGGAFLVAQPFDQQPVVPGATTDADIIAPVPFTVRFIPSGAIRTATTTTEGGVTKVLGNCWRPAIVDPSDPRLAGSLTFCGDDYGYGPSGSPSLWSATYRIENDEGAWQGSSAGAGWVDPESGDTVETEEFLVLVGEGAYEGTYAMMTFVPDWSDVRGVIFDGPLPAAPVPPSSE